MKKKIRYRTVPVQSIDRDKLLQQLESRRCIVALDIAKKGMVAGFADESGRCVRLAKFEHPKETPAFLQLVQTLHDSGLQVDVAMEPTGVYGDVLRYQLTRRAIPVFRVDPVRAHAMKSVLDGVPSMHDAKSCTLIAHLHAQGISSRWEDKEEFEHEMRTLVDEREMFAKPEERGCGQLEAYLARHFPELSELVDWGCSWYLHLLARFPSPAHIAAAPEEAKQCLQRAARGRLACADEVIERARSSLGVPVTEREAILVAAFADYMLDLRRRVRNVDRRIRAAVKHRPALASMVKTLGPITTAVLFADAGDPAKYASSAAYEKALGLNLKVRSSGEYVGPLRITKRGPPRARKYLYLAALRRIKHDDVVRTWYEARTCHRNGHKLAAVVAVMRKLARVIPYLARGDLFDVAQLFDLAKLNLTMSQPEALLAS